jgi:hypothetical protein
MGAFLVATLLNPSRLSVAFDDDRAMANAGLALVGVLSEKLGRASLSPGAMKTKEST